MDSTRGRAQDVLSPVPFQALSNLLFTSFDARVPFPSQIRPQDGQPGRPHRAPYLPRADGNFTLHEHDGETYAYEKGACATIPIHWDDATTTLTIGARNGAFPGVQQHRTFNIVWASEGNGVGVDVTRPVDRNVE